MSNMKRIMNTKWLLVTVILAVLLFAPAVTAQTRACELFLENSARDSYIRITEGLPNCGQRITLSANVCRLGFLLQRVGSPPGSVGAVIVRASDGSVIQRSPTTISAMSVGTTNGWYEFDLNVAVNEDVRLLVEFVGTGGDASNHIRVGYQSTNVIDGYLTYNVVGPPSENPDADATIRIYAEGAGPTNHQLTVASSPISGIPVHGDGVSIGDTTATATVIEGEHTISVPQQVTTSGNGGEEFTVGVDIYWGMTESEFTNRYRALMLECGIKMVRVNFVPSYINNLRTLIPVIVNSGIQVLGLLMDNNDPDDYTGYGNYVYDVVSEFKDYVHVWEIWNEPNLDNFFSGHDPVKYMNFLKEGYRRAKQADSTCFVLGCCVVFTHSTARNFLEVCYQNGAKDYMDALSYHPYADRWHSPDYDGGNNPYTWLASKVRPLMESYGDYRPIWITEFGYPTNSVSEATQADYLTLALDMAVDWGWIDTFIIYNWIDGGGMYFGLLNSGGSRKQAFYDVKQWIADYEPGPAPPEPPIEPPPEEEPPPPPEEPPEPEVPPEEPPPVPEPPPPLEHWNLNIASTEGGTTSPSGTMEVLEGRDVSVAANADLEWKISHWLFDGENVGNANPITIPAQDADTSHTLVAIFAQLPLTQVMHVESIAMSKSGSRNVWCRAVVTIADSNGNPVAGATVEGIWSGLVNREQSEVTGTDGKVTFYSYRIRSHWRRSTVTFTVDDVVKTGWTYDPQANKETSDSIVI